MQTIHESGVVAHLRRKRTEQVANPLLLFHVNIEIADHHDAARRRMLSLPRENSPAAM